MTVKVEDADVQLTSFTLGMLVHRLNDDCEVEDADVELTSFTVGMLVHRLNDDCEG